MNEPTQNLAGEIAGSDPHDAQSQTALLDRIRQLRGTIPKTVASDMAANLDMAVMLTQYLIRMGGIGPHDVLQIISRLVGEVELAFTVTPKKTTTKATLEPVAETQTTLRLIGQDERSRAKLLGEILIQLGHVDAEQVQQAIQTQKAAGVRIGEALVHSKAATWDQINKAVGIQKQLKRALGIPA
jgi:hypothetical protein